jgi:hypothetical protein
MLHAGAMLFLTFDPSSDGEPTTRVFLFLIPMPEQCLWYFPSVWRLLRRANSYGLEMNDSGPSSTSLHFGGFNSYWKSE